MVIIQKFALLFSILWGLGACQGRTSTPREAAIAPDRAQDCRTIRHEQGTTEICGQPRKVVVLGPYLLEQVIALGEQPAGFGDHIAFHQGDYDNPSQQIPYLGTQITTQPVNVGLAYQPNIEAILRVKPDLILAPNSQKSQYEQLAAIAPTLSFDIVDGTTHLQAIAKALNRTERAEQLMAETEERIKSAKKNFAIATANHPNILVLAAESTQSFRIMSHNESLCESLVKDLGFNFAYPKGFKEPDANGAPAMLSQETLPQLNTADSIILLGYNWDISGLANMTTFDRHQVSKLKQAWSENVIAQSLNASRAGRVYFIPAYLCLGLPGAIGTRLYLDELKKQLINPS